MEGINLQLFKPRSKWEASYPPVSLIRTKTLGIDLETKDPNLLSKGPGSFRRDGYPVGVSVSDGNNAWYLPFAHAGGGNLDPDTVFVFLKDLIDRCETLIGANILYDVEWLSFMGLDVTGKRLIDVQMTEALIDEEQTSYSLNALCNRYLGVDKDEKLLREAASTYGVDPKSELWKLPAEYVGPYACFDALSVVKINELQQKEIIKQDLSEVFELEVNLTPIIWKMRQQGIMVDLDKAGALSTQLTEEEESYHTIIFKNFGMKIDPWSGPALAKACSQLDIVFPLTNKDNPSFTSDWIKKQKHPFIESIAKIRELNRLRSMFIDQWIFDNNVGGVIHPVWHQMRNPDGGTRTGRMSASNPNPQQIPSRSDYAKDIRSLFIPGSAKSWCKIDYSQQEPRLMVHYAMLCKHQGVDTVARAYQDNPKADIYQLLAEAAKISRRDSKTITLGRCYGMGPTTMADKLNIQEAAAFKLIEQFDHSVPFIKALNDQCSNMAGHRGWIKTILGRRRHFNWWESTEYGKNLGEKYRDKDEAIRQFGSVRRAYARKALNSLIQGSAADMTKSAMVSIFKETGLVPCMQVHDELNYCIDDPKDADKLRQLAETCVKLEIPIVADVDVGEHWK
jgi:DNA polymerase I-like protein with 3'-5' exonuclease and polymerase domains